MCICLWHEFSFIFSTIQAMAFAPIALVITWLIFPLGQFGKPFFDILLFLLIILSLRHIKLSKAWILFLLITLLSFILNQLHQPLTPLPFLYLSRLVGLVLLFNIEKSTFHISKKWLVIAWTVCLVWGLLQYLFFPDNTILSSLGWDPHLNRLIGSFLDLTFTGIIYLLFFIYLFLNKYPKVFSILTYLGMALTYSRSSLLAFLAVLLFYCLKNKRYLLLVTGITMVCLTVLILPNEVGEGTNLSRTSTISAKIENYKEAFGFIVQKPLLGHGYNFLPQLRPELGHASSGFDSSLLTIAVTIGLIGLTCFLWAIKGQLDYYLLAVAIHSLFSNSLLYPWVFFLLFSLRLKYRK